MSIDYDTGGVRSENGFYLTVPKDDYRATIPVITVSILARCAKCGEQLDLSQSKDVMMEGLTVVPCPNCCKEG